eukprot:scaffold587_cov17-Prasinocladus_malaysianus.AAC.3
MSGTGPRVGPGAGVRLRPHSRGSQRLHGGQGGQQDLCKRRCSRAFAQGPHAQVAWRCWQLQPIQANLRQTTAVAAVAAVQRQTPTSGSLSTTDAHCCWGSGRDPVQTATLKRLAFYIDEETKEYQPETGAWKSMTRVQWDRVFLPGIGEEAKAEDR